MIRAVSHVHSTYSFDAKVPLPELAELFRGKGVQAVLMTEHVEPWDVATFNRFVAECRSLSTPDFLLLPGVELEYQNVLAFGVDHVDGWDAVTDLIETFREQGAFLALSHPRKLHPDAPQWAFPVVEGVEVWNRKYDGTRTMRPGSYALLERLAEEDRPLVPTAGLDFHRLSDWTDVWMELGAERPVREDVLAALRRGEVRIRAHGEVIPIYDDSTPGARALYQVKSAACTTVLDAAVNAHHGLSKAGISMPHGVKKFVRKLF